MNEPFKVLSTTRIGNQDFPIYGSVETPLFKVSDVANVLEHSNPRAMIQSVDEEEKVVSNAYTLGGVQDVTFLTEAGLYEVFFLSRKPIAKQFKKQVKVILKELRLKGEVSINPNRVSTSKARASMILIEGAQRLLRLSDSSVAMMVNKVADSFALPVKVDYVDATDVCFSLTTLLKNHNIAISSREFNKLLASVGIIEQKTRKSHKGDKHFWALTEKGLNYGENRINPNNDKEIQPMYYEKSFDSLLAAVNSSNLPLC